MGKFSPENERIKHRYFAFLGEAKRLSPSSVDQAAAAIADFEAANGWKDFRQFRIEQAQSYKRKLGAIDPGTGRGLAKATISSRLAALKHSFNGWLSNPAFGLVSPIPMPNISMPQPMTSELPRPSANVRFPPSNRFGMCSSRCR